MIITDFCLLNIVISMNKDVQSRLQEDIDQLFENKKPGEQLTQDEVTGMKYLDQVLSL